MKETQVTARMVKEFNKIEGSHFYKAHGGKFKSGHPDISGTIDGRGISGEVKMPDNYLTPLQAVELDKRRASGEITFLALYQPPTKDFQVRLPRGDNDFRWADWAKRKLPRDIRGDGVFWQQTDFTHWESILYQARHQEPRRVREV